MLSGLRFWTFSGPSFDAKMTTKSQPSTLLTALVAFAHIAASGWQYRSRPDLSSPRLNITIGANDGVAPGYIFVTPYPSFEPGKAVLEQPTAYIFREDGDLVWSGLGYLSGWVGNFRAVRYKGRPALQAF